MTAFDLAQGSLISLAAGSCQLIAAGGRASVAGNTADLFFNLLYGKPFNELRDRLQIAVASAGKLYIVHDVAVKLQLDFGGAGTSGLVCICHVFLLFIRLCGGETVQMQQSK